MAEAVLLSALLPVVFDKSADLIGKQLRKVLGVDVEKEVKKLHELLLNFQAVLRDAEEKQLANDQLRTWMEKLKLVAYDAEDLLDDFNLKVSQRREEDEERLKEKVSRFFSSDNPFRFRMTMARKIKDIVGRFDSIAEEMVKFSLIADAAGAGGRQPVTGQRRTQTYSYMLESEIIEREADVKNIVELLIGQEKERSVSVLPISGMGGLGKTTLAQMVNKHPRVSEHFQPRIWVCVSDDFDTAKIAKAVIESVTGKKCDISELDPLLGRLIQVLGAKRYLLVLDDVWNEEEEKWDQLRVPLTSSGRDGSAVIVTTRSDKVSSIVGTLPAYLLAHLPADDCWDLFTRLAFPGAEKAPPNLMTVGREIVKKCDGLPLAVKILGRLLQDKREERDWLRTRDSEIWELPVGQSKILPALRLSYTHLPPHVKQCFAFCAIFPKDYEMEKESLIQLWMANGFIPSDPGMELELKAEEVFNELAQRSFFQDVEDSKSFYSNSVKTICRMHDLIHDLAQSITRNECRVLGDHNKDKLEDLANSSIRHLSLADDFYDLDHLHYPKTMRTFLSLGNYISNPPSYPANRYLRVVDLNKREPPISISMYNLPHLRYLNLSHNDIETLPEAICGLFNLQTLKLIGCEKLLELPKGMRKMSSLRHLDLDGCSRLRCMPAGMGQLRCLRTLTMYKVGDEDGSGSIGELEHLNHLHGRLELRGLENVRNVTEARKANLCSKENLQHLVLKWVVPAVNAEEVLEALRPHRWLKRLEIDGYDGVRFPTWLMGDWMLQSNLVEISLYKCRRCEHLPQLGQLHFLEVLAIRGMPSVKHMRGRASGAGGTEFPLLKEFTLSSMDNLEDWSGAEGCPSFPSLVKLEVRDCPELRTMPELPSVQDLKIVGCRLLDPAKGLFGCMTSLETLKMVSCGLVAFPDFPGSLQSLDIKSCPNIHSLPEELGCLTALKSLCIWDLPSLTSLPEGMQGLTALESLDIRRLPSLTSLPEGVQGLTALESLNIWNLPSLTSLPEGM